MFFSSSSFRLLFVSAAVALGLAGCVESLPTTALPSLIKDDRKLLSKEEQTAAIGDLTRKKEAQQADTHAPAASKP
jgi:hypothetical protein